MLEDILKEIDKKAELKVNEALERIKSRVFDLEKNFQLEEKKTRQKALENFQEQIDFEVKEFESREKSTAQFGVLSAKLSFLKNIFEKALEKIADLPDKDYNVLVDKMIERISQCQNGRILADERTAKLLLKRLGGRNITVESGLGEPGFIFESPLFEIDLRFSQFLRAIEEKAAPEFWVLFEDVI